MWWHKDDPPDGWTPERQRKVRLIDRCDGDVEAAIDADRQRSRLRFAAWMTDTGRLSDGERRGGGW